VSFKRVGGDAAQRGRRLQVDDPLKVEPRRSGGKYALDFP
jgi:hypothetical protein